ncbi:ATPase AAA [Endozoicomonas montiporae]|uniref:ATPase AAA n=2 Tax=Endozoicomonas montiporae TaxID=1027273 RepID=A0A081NAM7_9GAMM|nr:AAA family ATPase [Endozoicomonas montiporae]AMO56818.1 MoxR-like ATPase [Endozoicomonas montiporae CL-33]KEQ15500.1 ATPase AAA [Endozoicomonas montiporae]
MNELHQCIHGLNDLIKGKEHEVRLAVCCLLSGGHLLVEDLPGMGKTTLAHGLATVMGLDYQRIQFTSDLLPADIIGVSVFEKQTESFRFHEGPVFSQLVLADEINRASPRTQSALLEAMEERQVTVEGRSLTLPSPFFVIATRNPSVQEGTFALPESQLDRFLMRIQLGYPDQASELSLLKGEAGRSQLQQCQPVLSSDGLKNAQLQTEAVHASDHFLKYLLRVVTATRLSSEFVTGLSPRASLALLQASKAWALLHDRDYAIPEDLQAVFSSVAEHRLMGREAGMSAQALLASVDVAG